MSLSDWEVFVIANNIIDFGWGECPLCSKEDRKRVRKKVAEGRRFWRGLDVSIRESEEQPDLKHTSSAREGGAK